MFVPQANTKPVCIPSKRMRHQVAVRRAGYIRSQLFQQLSSFLLQPHAPATTTTTTTTLFTMSPKKHATAAQLAAMRKAREAVSRSFQCASAHLNLSILTFHFQKKATPSPKKVARRSSLLSLSGSRGSRSALSSPALAPVPDDDMDIDLVDSVELEDAFTESAPRFRSAWGSRESEDESGNDLLAMEQLNLGFKGKGKEVEEAGAALEQTMDGMRKTMKKYFPPPRRAPTPFARSVASSPELPSAELPSPPLPPLPEDSESDDISEYADSELLRTPSNRRKSAPAAAETSASGSKNPSSARKAAPAPVPGAPNPEVCEGCVRSMVEGRRPNVCSENLASKGRRCDGCSAGHSCKRLPPHLRKLAWEFQSLYFDGSDSKVSSSILVLSKTNAR